MDLLQSFRDFRVVVRLGQGLQGSEMWRASPERFRDLLEGGLPLLELPAPQLFDPTRALWGRIGLGLPSSLGGENSPAAEEDSGRDSR